VVAAVVVVLAAGVGRAAEPTAEDCLTCHDEALETGDKRAIAAFAKPRFDAAAHHDLACTTATPARPTCRTTR
jgi:hypothetical protein